MSFHVFGDTFATKHKTAIIDGVKLFYREAGPEDAPVVLLLHGFPSSSRMFTRPGMSEIQLELVFDYHWMRNSYQ